MGGFARPFTEPIASAVGKGIDSVFSHMEQNAGGRFAMDLLSSMERDFKGHPVGEVVHQMTQDGIYERNRVGTQISKPLDDFQKIVSKDPSLAKMHDYKKAPLAQIHNSLPVGHPGQQALAPLMNNTSHHTMTLDELGAKMWSEANAHGREVAFGPNGRNLAATIYPMLRSGNPTERTKADAMLDTISQVFRDNQAAKKGAQGIEESGIKTDVQKYMTRMGRAYQGQPKGYVFPMNTKVGYTKGGPGWQAVEKTTAKYNMTYLAPWIALTHMMDFYKLPMSVPSRALWHNMSLQSTPHMEQMKAASGIFYHTMHSIIHNDFAYRTGTLGKVVGSDAAAIINKSYHSPGFNNLRMFQLSTFGSAGYHSVQLWAKQAVRGSKLAAEELAEVGLDVNAIIRRNGNLTDDELSKSIFHFVNNRLFIDKPLDRARLSQSSPFMRIGTFFHGYVTKEGSFLANEFSKAFKDGNILKMAQFAGTVGLIFPATVPLLLSLQTLVRTASPQKAEQNLEQTYQKLLHPQGFGDFAGEYFNILAHLSAGGAFMQYVHSAMNHRLLYSFFGPAISVAAGTAEDVLIGAGKVGKRTGEHNYRPAERDILQHFTLPILGNWAAEYFVPKGQQGSLNLRTRSHRGAGRRR